MKTDKKTPSVSRLAYDAFLSVFPKGGQRGFTLLLAALVASVVLALGTSIYTIASEEVSLSATGRDSQFAFYAADSAAECALYWDARSDIHPNTFATSSASSPASAITCDGATVSVTKAAASASSATSTFEVTLFDDTSAGYCADVTVEKNEDPSTHAERTAIDANGYSVSCAAIDTAPNALQRSVELQY